MSLRRRTLFIGAALLIGLILTLYAILSSVITSNFAELERQSTARDVQRVMNAVSDMQNTLASNATDYAKWDDLYAFVEDHNPEFATANFENGAFINLAVNLVMVVNTSGDIIYGNSYDPVTQKLGPVPPEFVNRLTTIQRSGANGLASFSVLPQGTLLFASQPILKSGGLGTSRGMFIMGRYLDDEAIKELSQKTQLSIGFNPNDAQLPSALKSLVAKISANMPIAQQVIDEHSIVAGSLLNDVDGQSTLLVTVTDPRSIHQFAQSSLTYLVVALIGAGLVFGLVMLFVLDRSILSRVTQLSRTLSQMTVQRSLSQRLPETGNDELSDLAKSFNNLASQLENTVDSLENRVEERTAQLQASADVGRAATSRLNPDELLKESVQLIAERFGFYYVGIFLVDDARRWAVLHEASGPGDTPWVLKQAGHRLEVGGQSMVSMAVTTRQAAIALDVGAAAVRFANPLLPDTRSEIALPLIVGDQVLGALDVQSTQAAAFDQANALVLQAMADQIAVALNNATQFRREAGRAQQFTGLLQAALELSAQPDRAQLLQRVAQVVTSLVDADGVGLWFPIDENTLELQYSINVGAVEFTGRQLRIGDGLSGQAFASGLTLRVDDYLSWSGHSASFADAPFHSAICTPLLWQGRAAGVLAVTRSQSGQPFTAEHENLLQIIATQIASALDNLRLRAEQQRALEEVNTLNRRLVGEAWQAETLGGAIKYEYHTRAGDEPPAAGLSMEFPIVLRGVPIGAISLQDDRPRELSDDERSLIDGVVQQMALALENQRLTASAQQAAQRDRTIAETADKIHQPTDLDSVLRVAVAELRRVTGIEGIGVQLGFAPATNGNGHHEELGV